MNMKNRTLYCFLGLFALGVSCTSVSSEEDMYALALKKNPALRHVLELYEGGFPETAGRVVLDK